MRDLVIYSSLLSANCRKVQYVCLQLGIEAQVVETNVYADVEQSKEFLKVNPLHKIPALTDSDIVLNESNAIIIYLSEKYGRQSLYSQHAGKRAEINKWLFWESSQWQPLLIKVMERHVGNKLLPSIIPKPRKPVDWELDDCVLQLSYLNRSLSGKDYLVGDGLTLADISVAAMATYFRVAKFPYEQYENIKKWLDTISCSKAWKLTTHPIWQIEKT